MHKLALVESREDDIPKGVTPKERECLFRDGEEEVPDLPESELTLKYRKKVRAVYDKMMDMEKGTPNEDLMTIAWNEDKEFKAQKKLENLANHDELTGLPNYRAYLEGGKRIISLARRKKEECVVLMVDLDNFKNVNDSFGHSVGDEVLKKIAQILQEICRESDLAARPSGDEFIVVLPEVNIKNARIFAERIRKAVEAKMIEYGVTSSIGIAGSSQIEDLQKKTNPEFLAELQKLADKALYVAKKNGRNQVVSGEKKLKTTGQFLQFFHRLFSRNP